MKKPLTIAVAKGYLWKEAQSKLEDLGVEFEDDLDSSRRLYHYDKSEKLKVLMVRSWDVPVYVEEGAADIGIVGKDVLIEQSPRCLELLDLQFGGCSLVLAGPKGCQKSELTHHIKVATKYTESTQRYFDAMGLNISLIKLYGAIELAPTTGISQYICDLTATGTTLKENGLDIMDTLYSSTARLIANPISMKRRYDDICRFQEALSALL